MTVVAAVNFWCEDARLVQAIIDAERAAPESPRRAVLGAERRRRVISLVFGLAAPTTAQRRRRLEYF